MIQIWSKEFVDKLKFVEAGTSRVSAIETYGKGLVEQIGGAIYLRAYNLISHSVVRLCESEPAPGPTRMLVNVARLIAALEKIDTALDVTFDFAASAITVKGGGIKLKHLAEPDPGFRDLPVFSKNSVDLVDGPALADNIKKASFAIDARSYLDWSRGLHLTCNGSIEFASTDGITLAVITVENNGTDFKGEATIPVESLELLRSVLDLGGTPKFSMTKEEVSIVAGDYAVSSILLASKYPNYRGLIIEPEGCDKVIVGRTALANAARIVEQYSGDYHDIFLDILLDGTINVRGGSADKGDSVCTLPYLGGPIEITLKLVGKKLVGAISALRTDDAVLCIPKVDTPTSIGFVPGDNGSDMRVTVGLLNQF